MPLLESSTIEMIKANDIIDGNPIKKLMILHAKSLAQNTNDASSEYINYCSTLPVSVILDHSDIIFTDSRYGLDMYKDMISSVVLPFHSYGDELEKVENFVKKVTDFSEEERADYNEVISILREKKALYEKGCAPFSAKLALCDDTDDLLNDIFDAINDDGVDPQIDVETAVNNLMENKYAFFLYGPLLYSLLEDDYSLANRLNRLVTDTCEDFSEFVETIDSLILVSIFAQDPGYKKICEDCRNKVFRDKILDMMNTKVLTQIQNVMQPIEPVSKVELPSGVDALSYIDSIADLCNPDTSAPMIKEERNKLLGEVYSRFAGHLSTILMFTEYEDRDKYIYNGEIPFNATNRNLYTLIREAELKLQPILESFGCDLYDETFFEAVEEDTDKEVEKIDKQDKSDKEYDDDDDDGPPKEKKSLFQRMTHHAMDKEKKNKDQKQKFDKTVHTVKNFARAETSVPKHVIGQGQNMIDGIRNMDKKRLRKKMLRDGWRSNLWKTIIRLTKYGALSLASPLLVPVFWFARKVSKTKNKRLKDEVLKDFELEIDILKEKYQNARDDHDNKNAIKIKRTLDKVMRERDRVKYNTKVLS